MRKTVLVLFFAMLFIQSTFAVTIECKRDEGTFDSQKVVVNLVDINGKLYQSKKISTLEISSRFGRETIAMACAGNVGFGEIAIYPMKNKNRCLAASNWGEKAINEFRLHFGFNTGYFALSAVMRVVKIVITSGRSRK